MGRSHVLILTVLLVLTAAVYAPLRSAPFVYEDENWLRQIHDVPQWTIPSRGLTHSTFRLTGLDAGLAHRVNVALHLGNGLLVYGMAASVAAPAVALSAAAVFLLHPLNSQAVAYVSARSDLLSTFGILLAVWLALLGRRWVWPLVLGALALAATSKEMGLVGVPLVIGTLLIWRRERTSTPLACSLAAIAGGAALGMAWPAVSSWILMRPHVGGSQVPWWQFLGLQLTGIGALLTRVIWPVGFSLDHDWQASAPAVRVVTVCALAPLLPAIVWAWRRAPIVVWGLGWLVVGLSPRLIFRTAELVQEHHLYLAMAGVSVLAGACLAPFAQPSRKAVLA